MKKLQCRPVRAACLGLASSLVLGVWGAEASQKTSGAITTFDVPGAGGTYPVAINTAGAIAGSYSDSVGTHGFVLNTDGSFTTFDAPAAAGDTVVSGLDDAGVAVGTYVDANAASHGFSRTAAGIFTVLTGKGGTTLLPAGVAPLGGVTGSTVDVNSLSHGFRISTKGRYRAFEVPGSGVLSYQGTQGDAINDAGQIGGIYIDLAGDAHPYVRAKSGVVTALTPPGVFVSHFSYEFAPYFVPGIAINAAGAVMGNYFQSISGNPYGGDINVFIQGATGAAIVFGIGDTGPCCIFTYGTGINASGTVIGYDNDYYNLDHGYVRTPDGTVTTFDAPGAGTGFYQGTLPAAINAAGVITGLYEGDNYAWHGFIRQP